MPRGIIVAIALIATLLAEAQKGDARQVETGAERVPIELCSTAENMKPHAWTANLFVALEKFLNLSRYPADLKVEFSARLKKCQKMIYGCKVEGNQIVCSEHAMGRLMFGLAWLAARYGQLMTEPSKERADHLNVTVALGLADAYTAGDENRVRKIEKTYSLDSSLTKLVLDLYDAHKNPKQPRKSPPLKVAASIYVVASTELAALILGHEFAHAMGACHVDTPASVEVSGLFERLVSMQAKGHLYIRNAPDLDEVLADQCALRALARVDQSWIDMDARTSAPLASLARATTSVGRRLALDMFAAVLAMSLSEQIDIIPDQVRGRPKPGLYVVGPDGQLMSLPPDGYLYPASRLALVSALLSEREAKDPHIETILCDLTARRFVMMVDQATGAQPGHAAPAPQLAELFQGIVPRGVVESWKTGVWKDKEPSSYACAGWLHW